MERISVMEWSIELEMALRSKKRGRAVEAILQLGRRIQQWSKEPEPTMGVYNMFNLVPGEDSLFANTILLRLADAFRLGDVNTRIAVVKVFLMELRSRRKYKTSKPYKGLLSKASVHNRMELLERVKIVFDTGGVESRSLVLLLFGCWADFAKDSAHVRYLILSTMLSAHILEIKASLFAAGCFCELACDFASVAMEMIFNIVASSEILPGVKLAGVRVFAKMGCSHDIANRAYKTGLKLVSESSDDEVLAAMLVSLSILACRSTLILSNQVDLLFSFLGQEKTLRLQATTLRCIKFIFVRQACRFPVHMDAIRTLFTAIKSTILPSNMQFEALQILCKMLLHRLASLPNDNITEFSELSSVVDSMLEFVHLLTTVENSGDSLVRSKGILAIHTLVNVLSKLKGRGEMGESGDISHPLSVRIISTIQNWLFFLVKLMLELGQADAKIFKEVQSLLSLLLFLVGDCSDLGVSVLDTARLFVKHLAELCNQVMGPGQACLVQNEKVAASSEKQIDIVLKLVYDVHQFFVFCIETLSETGALSEEIIGKLQLLIECVHQCSYFDCYTYLMYSMLLHSHIIWGLVNKSKVAASNLDRFLDNPLCNLLVESEIRSLELVKKMPEKDNWLAYKIGSFAACQGAWVIAAFIYEQLLNKVEHESFVCWLNSLALFSQSESKIQLVLLPTLQSALVELSQKKEFSIATLRNDVHIDGSNISESNHASVFAEACHGIHCSRLALESNIEAGKLFYFQRWFLALRVKVLGLVVDMLNILDTISHGEGTIGNKGQGAKNSNVDFANSLHKLTELSSMLRRVAEGFDLLAMSFIGMDGRSLKTISAIAVSCSVLAFAAGFAPLFPNLLTDEISLCSLKKSNERLQTMLIQDLVGRLWLIDRETCSNLCLLLDIGKRQEDYFHTQSRNCILICGNEIRNMLHVCKYAVSSILGLQNEAKKMKKDEALSRVCIDGMQILSNTVKKWMHVPFRIPRHFFKVRPRVGSELFAFNGDASNQYELSVLPGFHLSLNLCLKLRNVPSDFQIRLKSMHCIFYTSTSFHEPRSNGETKERVQLDYLAWEDDDLVQMNEKLLRYVRSRSKKTSYNKHSRREGSDNDDHSECAFASFELNDVGQGFSNCLLDVSNFPVGSYRIKWHSCCIDSESSYWSLLPLNAEPVFNVQKLSVVV